MNVRAGKLRHRITIEAPPAGAEDSLGHKTGSWTTFAITWAEIEEMSGLEDPQAAQVQPEVTHKVKIRYLAGLTSKHRVIHKGRTLEIATPPRDVSDGKERMLLFGCIERT